MINYFDLGLYTGSEMKWMLGIFKSLEISDFRAFGFEPDKNNLRRLVSKIKNNPKVHIIPKAIAPVNGTVKLYKCTEGSSGNSLFASKINVDENKYDLVDGVVFSDWLNENVPTFKTDFNIIRMNMEGSEYHFFQDVISNNLNKHVDLFCGAPAGKDVKKIKELAGEVDSFMKLLSDNKIEIQPFADQKEKVPKIKKIIKNRLR